MTGTDCKGPLPATSLRIRRLEPSQISVWLTRGWQDMRHIGWPSYLHGILVCLLSMLVLRYALYAEYLLPGLAGAFVLVGPMLATGLYGLSRRRESGAPAHLHDAVCAWRSASHCLLRFSLLLVGIGVAWVAVSAILFELFVNARIDNSASFAHYVLNQGFAHFMLWTLLGSLVAAVVFAASVIAIPLLLDRDLTTRTAILSSIRVVGENPVTMVLWALFIAFATGLGVVTGMLGFIVLYPLMGHASWHAYRALVLVDEQAVPPRHDTQDA